MHHFNLAPYPFDDLINPYLQELEAAMENWINALRLSGEQKVKLRKMRLAHFTARVYPYTGLPALITAGRLVLWVIVNDDVNDTATSQELEHTCQQTLRAFDEAPPPPDDYEYYHLLSFSAKEIRERPMSAHWTERFKIHLYWYLRAMQWSADFNHAGTYPSDVNYSLMRLKAGSVLMFTDLIEYAINLELPAEIIRHPVIENLTDITNVILCLSNDVFSLDKEQQASEAMNMILVLQHENGITIPEALSKTVNRHDKYLDAYLELRNTLPDFGSWTDPVNKYIYGLETWMQGHLTWMVHDTARFLVPDNK